MHIEMPPSCDKSNHPSKSHKNCEDKSSKITQNLANEALSDINSTMEPQEEDMVNKLVDEIILPMEPQEECGMKDVNMSPMNIGASSKNVTGHLSCDVSVITTCRSSCRRRGRTRNGEMCPMAVEDNEQANTSENTMVFKISSEDLMETDQSRDNPADNKAVRDVASLMIIDDNNDDDNQAKATEDVKLHIVIIDDDEVQDKGDFNPFEPLAADLDARISELERVVRKVQLRRGQRQGRKSTAK